MPDEEATDGPSEGEGADSPYDEQELAAFQQAQAVTQEEHERQAQALEEFLAANPKWVVVAGALRYRTIHELLGLILEELPAIGKNQQAPSAIGGYAFRGIEDVLTALNPLLSKYGVFPVPEVLGVEHLPDRGKEHVCVVTVAYTFYGPAGDSVRAVGAGEGSDTRDKGMQKAMTSAFKYVLFQALAISTEEGAKLDVDRNVPDESELPPPTPMREAQVISILERLRPHLGEDDDGKLVYPEAWRDARAAGGPGTLSLETLEAMATGERPLLTEAFAYRMNDVLTALEADEIGHLPCVLCGRTNTKRARVDGEVRCQRATDCRKYAQDHQVAREGEEASAPRPAPPPSGEDGESFCAGCGERLGDDESEHDGQRWHPECLPEEAP